MRGFEAWSRPGWARPSRLVGSVARQLLPVAHRTPWTSGPLSAPQLHAQEHIRRELPPQRRSQGVQDLAGPVSRGSGLFLPGLPFDPGGVPDIADACGGAASGSPLAAFVQVCSDAHAIAGAEGARCASAAEALLATSRAEAPAALGNIFVFFGPARDDWLQPASLWSETKVRATGTIMMQWSRMMRSRAGPARLGARPAPDLRFGSLAEASGGTVCRPQPSSTRPIPTKFGVSPPSHFVPIVPNLLRGSR